MASILDPGEIREGRDGPKELYRLVNWLRRHTGSLTSFPDNVIPFSNNDGSGTLTSDTTFWRDPADGTLVVGKAVNDWSGQAIGLFSRSTNDQIGVIAENLSTGTSAAAALVAYAGSTDYMRFGVLGPNTNTYIGALSTPGSGFISHATAGAAPLVINSGGTGDVVFATTNLNVERARITTTGNVVIGAAALATTATDGFLYIPTCAGAPTGVPTAYAGRVPIVFDTTNSKFYVYNGAWIGGTTPGAWT